MRSRRGAESLYIGAMMNTTAILGLQDRRGKEMSAMPSATSQQQAACWLTENGPKELESLFRAIVYHPSAPILIADNDRRYRDASSGAG